MRPKRKILHKGELAYLYEVTNLKPPCIDLAVAQVKGFRACISNGKPAIINGSLAHPYSPSSDKKTIASLVREENIYCRQFDDGIYNTFRITDDGRMVGGSFDKNILLSVCKTIILSSKFNWKGCVLIPETCFSDYTSHDKKHSKTSFPDFSGFRRSRTSQQ